MNTKEPCPICKSNEVMIGEDDIIRVLENGKFNIDHIYEERCDNCHQILYSKQTQTMKDVPLI